MTARLLNDYGMFIVLVALCVMFSLLTLKPQSPTSDAAVEELVTTIERRLTTDEAIIVAGSANRDSEPIARKTAARLKQQGFSQLELVVGSPRDLKIAMQEMARDGNSVRAVVASGSVLSWRVLQQTEAGENEEHPLQIVAPRQRYWPDFLKRANLLAIVDRIVVIAVIAIGMTLVIITAGIDLAVGSLIALSTVVSTLVMKQLGGLQADGWAVLVGFLAGIASCGLVGLTAGLFVARTKLPPFIVTLSFMMMTRGLAFLITGGNSIYQVPSSLPWLGQGRSFGLPNTVILLIILYAVAHLFMAHTRLGRYIYAVGGNIETARLSGVPVGLVLLFVYTVSGLSAGLGGCIQASQLNTGTPNVGVMYELYVIAAVVLGGTSLSGGTGRILGTLIGAFIISVIQNGMNLLGMESYTQQVVLGGVILGAVLLDKIRSSGQLVSLVKKSTSST